MIFKIEDNIPIPETSKPHSQSLTSFISRLEVKQSLLVPGKKRVGSVSYAIQKAKYGNEKTFHAAVVDGGVRIWRME